jgi:radical SAM superfamily enzyme YgiQ (UPF0313 family)
MNKIKIGLVEIGDSFGGQYYLPYSIGILRAYAEKTLVSRESYKFLPIVYKREPIEKIVDRLREADIVFYSVYLWNSRFSTEIAHRIKKLNPDVINVFGGPQIPESRDKVFSFLRNNSSIEITSFGEGEIPFTKILENYENKRWEDIPAIAFRRSDNSTAFNERSETVQDINQIPSPYLTGIFDELIEQNPKEIWQARLETNRGCPFTCAFCYWGKKSTRKIRKFNLDRIYKEIDWISRNKIEFVFCCDANFGILKRDADIARKVAENKKSHGYPQAFSIQNTKNSTERIFELQKILNDSGLQKGVNLALQSLNDITLRYIARSNIDKRIYAELQKLFSNNNIATFSDLIVGLPGETYESFTRGVSEIIESGQHNRIQFINLTVLENTLMANPEFQKNHEFTITETELIPHHSSLNAMENMKETQNLVTATASMPKGDWIRARVFSWMASLLHFDKLLQIPFVIIHEVYGISYKDMIEAFMAKHDEQTMLTGIISDFEQKAASILNGDGEYCKSKKWLNLSWYPDELQLITIIFEGNVDRFYEEAETRLTAMVKNHTTIENISIISDAIHLNRVMLKQPFLKNTIQIKINSNIWEIYQAVLKGYESTLKMGSIEYEIDRTTRHWDSWDDWCRDVIWYGNKKGDYVYPVKRHSYCQHETFSLGSDK